MADKDLSRREFCTSVIAGTTGLAMGLEAVGGTDRRPNILFITTDDQGPQVGCYGDPFARTPNLDKFAGQGIRFTNGYVTQASCSPSRSSMFTGLYPHQNGQIGLSHRGYSMHTGIQTLPALLKQAGYFTGVIGKVHVRPKGAVPFDWRGIGHGATRDVRNVVPSARKFFDTASDTPFFFMVNLVDPHRPLIDQKGGIPKEPAGSEDVLPFDFLAGANSEKLRGAVAGYYNCVWRIDAGVAMLLDQLDKAGHADNTLVVFIGDHGPPFARAKTSCYEAGLRIPFIMRWPGHIEAGAVSDALVSTIDLMPTFLQAARAAIPNGLAGRSMVPLVTGEDNGWRQTLCCEYTSHCRPHFYPRRTIRDSRYKLIVNLLHERRNPALLRGFRTSRQDKYDNTVTRRVMDRYANPPKVELYDLFEDPDELFNLAGDERYAGIQSRLMNQLKQWQKETDDPLADAAKLKKMTEAHDGSADK